MTGYPTFGEFLRERAGANWVLARKTARIVGRYGDDVTCLFKGQYEALRSEWVAAHPATLMATNLPPDEVGNFIRAAVYRELAAA